MRYNYACQKLRNQDMEIYLDNHTQILDGQYSLVWPKPRTILNKSFEGLEDMIPEEEYLEKIQDYGQFVGRFNHKIIKYRVTGAKYSGQRIMYKIVREDVFAGTEITKLRDGHYVVIDWKNRRLRGVGKRFYSSTNTRLGDWVAIDKESNTGYKPKEFSLNVNYIMDRSSKKIRNMIPTYGNEKKFIIPEIVIGVSEQGYIVTMPQPKKDNLPIIIINGKRGTGKSLLEHVLEDGVYEKWPVRCCNANDIKSECHTRCKPWREGHQFFEELKHFGEKTKPLPSIYIYPTTKKQYRKHYMEDIGFEVSLPFSRLLMDEDMLQANDAWKMNHAGAELAWKNLVRKDGKPRRDGLLFKRNRKEVMQYIKNKVSNASTRGKIMRVIDDVFNSNMVDISSNTSSKWILKKGDEQIADTPWNTAIRADLFPYLNTKAIRDEIWYPVWLRFVIRTITELAENEKIAVMIFLDEVAPIMKARATQQIVERAIRESRSSGIAYTIVSQYNKDVPESIQTHKDYRFVFSTNETDLIKSLKLPKNKKNEIPRLKQFQCYAFGKFKLYDSDGSSKIVENKPIKIVKVKPPNSRHSGGIK